METYTVFSCFTCFDFVCFQIILGEGSSGERNLSNRTGKDRSTPSLLCGRIALERER